MFKELLKNYSIFTTNNKNTILCFHKKRHKKGTGEKNNKKKQGKKLRKYKKKAISSFVKGNPKKRCYINLKKMVKKICGAQIKNLPRGEII